MKPELRVVVGSDDLPDALPPEVTRAIFRHCFPWYQRAWWWIQEMSWLPVRAYWIVRAHLLTCIGLYRAKRSGAIRSWSPMIVKNDKGSRISRLLGRRIGYRIIHQPELNYIWPTIEIEV